MATGGGALSGQSRPDSSAGKRFWSVVITVIVVLASVVVTAAVVETINGGVVITVRTDKNDYVPGEQVDVMVEFRNNGHEPVSLTFHSSLVSSFTVYDGSGAFVCSLEQIALFWMVYETLEPGEILTGGCHWDQVYDEGIPVPHPGSYTIVAHALCEELDLSSSTRLFIA